MPTWTAEDGDVHVYTFKAGLLSPMAHDLKIRVTRFRIEADLENGRLEATFDAGSLRVVSAMKDGQEHKNPIVEAGRGEIESNIEKDVLHPRRFPEIRFAATDVIEVEDGWRIVGDLTLHGQRRRIETRARAVGGRWLAEVSLHQPDFHIKPYSAMMGTIKVQPDVRVEVSVPAA